MSRPPKSLRRLLLTASVVLMGLATAPLAHATEVDDLLGEAAQETTISKHECAQPGASSKVFERWGDDADYAIAPDGDFEQGGAGWALDGARVVDHSNRADLGEGRGERALEIGSGEVAISPAICATTDTPTLRFFARSTGLPTGVLTAALIYKDGSQVDVTEDLGIASANFLPFWEPAFSKPLALALPIGPGETMPTKVVLAVVGFAARFEVDDLYVDPYRRG